MRLRLPFAGSDSLEESYSGLGQDLFVLMLLDGKRSGTFLEIGANDPIKSSNTYLLEKSFGWTGVSVEIGKVYERRFNLFRKSNLVLADARRLDYRGILPSPIDYLSVDIDPPENTFEALEAVVSAGLRFRVATFEHDYYNFGCGPKIRLESREFLEAEGYELLVADVSFNGLRCEDWWVDTNLVDLDRAIALWHTGPVDFDSFIAGVECDD